MLIDLPRYNSIHPFSIQEQKVTRYNAKEKGQMTCTKKMTLLSSPTYQEPRCTYDYEVSCKTTLSVFETSGKKERGKEGVVSLLQVTNATLQFKLIMRTQH